MHASRMTSMPGQSVAPLPSPSRRPNSLPAWSLGGRKAHGHHAHPGTRGPLLHPATRRASLPARPRLQVSRHTEGKTATYGRVGRARLAGRRAADIRSAWRPARGPARRPPGPRAHVLGGRTRSAQQRARGRRVARDVTRLALGPAGEGSAPAAARLPAARPVSVLGVGPAPAVRGAEPGGSGPRRAQKAREGALRLGPGGGSRAALPPGRPRARLPTGPRGQDRPTFQTGKVKATHEEGHGAWRGARSPPGTAGPLHPRRPAPPWVPLCVRTPLFGQPLSPVQLQRRHPPAPRDPGQAAWPVRDPRPPADAPEPLRGFARGPRASCLLAEAGQALGGRAPCCPGRWGQTPEGPGTLRTRIGGCGIAAAKAPAHHVPAVSTHRGASVSFLPPPRVPSLPRPGARLLTMSTRPWPWQTLLDSLTLLGSLSLVLFGR